MIMRAASPNSGPERQRPCRRPPSRLVLLAVHALRARHNLLEHVMCDPLAKTRRRHASRVPPPCEIAHDADFSMLISRNGGSMKFFARTGCAALCAMAMSSGPAQTQTSTSPDPNKAAYQDLVTQGFEVKTVLLLPQDVSTRLSNASQPDTVIAVLQKGAVTATCWITLSAWSAHNIAKFPCNLLHPE